MSAEMDKRMEQSEMQHEAHETTHDLDQLWQETGGDRLLDGQSFQEAFDALDPQLLQKAISPAERKVAICMDDRLSAVSEGDDTEIVAAAGAFILLPQEEAVQNLRAKGIIEVRAHTNCGAGGVYVQRNELTPGMGDYYANERAHTLANFAGITAGDPITVDPHEPHVARFALLPLDTPMRRDVIGTALPPHFLISAYYYPSFEGAVADAVLAPQIEFNREHGFGDRFKAPNPEAEDAAAREGTPFYIVLTAKDENLLAERVKQMEDAIAVLPEEVSSRVKVEGVKLAV